ncbi:MAG: hypothetical protein ACRDRY_06255 [Pseudonocardiaceae bacterium]
MTSLIRPTLRVPWACSKTKMITIVYLTAAKLQLPTLTRPTPAYMSSR